MARLFPPGYQFTDASGSPVNSGTLTLYNTGTTTLSTIYTDEGLTTEAQNPSTLGTDGRAYLALWSGSEHTLSVVDRDGGTVPGYATDNFRGIPSDSSTTVATVAAMKAIPAPANGSIITTLGYSTAGIGAASYRVDTSDTSTADDGGMVIVATDGTRLKAQIDGAIPVTIFGALPDGSTDNKTAFQNWAKYLNANAPAAGYVPAGHYMISEGFLILSDVEIYGDGDATLIQNNANDTDGADFWVNTCIQVGNYFGHSGAGSPQSETSYELSDIAAGARSVTFVTAGDSANFTADEQVFIVDPHVVASTFERHAHVNEITSVSSGVLALKYAIPDAYTADGATKVAIYRASAADSTIPNSPGLRIQGETISKLACRSTVRDIRFKQSVSLYGQAVHLACHECRFVNITLDGVASGFGINPCSHTTFDNIRIKHRWHGCEFAAMTNDVKIRDWDQTRISEGKTDSNSSFCFLISETGQDFDIDGMVLRDFDWTGDNDDGCLGIQNRRVRVNNLTTIGSQSVGVAFTGSDRSLGSSLTNSHIIAPKTTGIQVDCDGITVANNHVQGINSGSRAMTIDSAVVSGNFHNNVLGTEGATAITDFIYYTGTPGKEFRCHDNIHHLSGRGEVDYTAEVITGTASAADIKSYSIPADSSAVNAGWKVRASGTVAGTAGTKTIILQCGGGDAETLSYGSGDTGTWWIEATIVKQSNTSQAISSHSFDNGTTGVQHQGTATSVNMVSASYGIELNIAVAGASDTVTVREWSVEPFNDQYDTI